MEIPFLEGLVWEDAIRLVILLLVIVGLYWMTGIRRFFKHGLRGAFTPEYINHLAKTKGIDYAPIGIITINSSGLVVAWSKGAEDIFEYTEEEMLGRPLTDIMPDRYKERHTQALEKIRHTGVGTIIGKTVRMEGVRKNKKEFPIKLTVWQWKEKPYTFYTGIVRDMSADSVMSSYGETLLKIYTEAEKIGGYGVYCWDILKDTVTYSDGFKRLFNIGAEQLDSGSILKHVYFEDKPLVDEALKRLAEEKKTYEIEYRIVDMSGRLKKVHSKSKVNLDSNGNIDTVIGIIHEIKS